MLRVRSTRPLVSAIAACGVVAVSACGQGSPGPAAVHAVASAAARSSSSPAQASPAGASSASASSAGASSASAGNPGSGWTLTWQDDFTGSGALRGWAFLNGGTGWGNKELQRNDPRNVSLAPGGGLVITAAHTGYGGQCWYGPCRYSGARLQTEGTFAQKYGLFEARIKLPAGAGLWPAFWMEGADVRQVSWPASGEIDVVEVNNKKPDLVEAFAHAPDESYGAYYRLANSLAAGYHTYAINWTAHGITWLVDGRAYGHINAYAGWPFDQPFFLILSVAVGGTWPGPPTSRTRFPAHMDVSWIRVYRQKA